MDFCTAKRRGHGRLGRVETGLHLLAHPGEWCKGGQRRTQARKPVMMHPGFLTTKKLRLRDYDLEIHEMLPVRVGSRLQNGNTRTAGGWQKKPESTGLEPATSAVTGRRSDQLS